MSPHAALTNPVFQFYVALAGGLLLGAGVLLAVLKWGLGRDVEHALNAYRGWLLMGPPVLGCIFLGRIATIILVTLIAALGFKEFARATGLYGDWIMTGGVYAGMLCLGYVSFLADAV